MTELKVRPCLNKILELEVFVVSSLIEKMQWLDC